MIATLACPPRAYYVHSLTAETYIFRASELIHTDCAKREPRAVNTSLFSYKV